jgi:hypothetical protein
MYRLIKGTDMNFTQYMLDFYGPNGVYPEGFTSTQISLATQLYKCRLPEGTEFYGDSIDRERVRDIILAAREETVPEFAKI